MNSSRIFLNEETPPLVSIIHSNLLQQPRPVFCVLIVLVLWTVAVAANIALFVGMLQNKNGDTIAYYVMD